MPGFFPISPSCPSYFPGVDSSVCVRAPVENLLIGLKPEYLMLSLWLFFLLIEAFTKMTFSISSTYSPRLPNGVFIQDRAWRRFALTAFPPARGWAPPCGRVRGAEAHRPEAESRGAAEAGARPHVCQTRGHQDGGKTQKRCHDKPSWPSSLSCVFQSQQLAC